MIADLPKIFETFGPQCDWLGLRYMQKRTQRRSMRNLIPQENEVQVERGIMMEVVMNYQLCYGATSDLSEQGLKRCFDQTKLQAQNQKNYGLKEFNPKNRGSLKGQYQSLRKSPLNQLDIKDLIDLQIQAGGQLQETPNHLSSWVSFWLTETKAHYLNSNGADIQQDWERFSQTTGVTAQKGPHIQTRSDGGLFANSYQMGSEGLRKEVTLERIERLSREVNELLEAEECPETKCDLLVMPNQMMLQIHESIGHPLELDRILGDERNYAGQSFVSPEDFGHLQYGPPLLNVTFDPLHEGEFASYGFDDVGLEAKKKHLIKEGKLVAGLGGSESQERLKLDGVSNMRSQSWNRAPIDRMANINIEPGQSNFKEMIESIEFGILVDTNRSWSIDDYRNKFQFGCEYGQLIKDGKIQGVVKNPNYRGVTVPFWNSLKMLGDASTFETYGTPFCGKGEPNQIIDVGHASPSALFENIEVFGGAE